MDKEYEQAVDKKQTGQCENGMLKFIGTKNKNEKKQKQSITVLKKAIQQHFLKLKIHTMFFNPII